jgi:hypothetical protein
MISSRCPSILWLRQGEAHIVRASAIYPPERAIDVEPKILDVLNAS